MLPAQDQHLKILLGEVRDHIQELKNTKPVPKKVREESQVRGVILPDGKLNGSKSFLVRGEKTFLKSFLVRGNCPSL